MRRTPLLVAALALCAATASAQKPQTGAKQAGTPKAASAGKYAAFAGVWDGKSMVGANDSVVTTYKLTINGHTGGGTMKFPNRKPVAVKLVTMGGDSLVTQTAKYSSILRKGQTVSVRTTSRVSGDNMSGTFVATYGNGQTVQGKTAATRAKP